MSEIATERMVQTREIDEYILDNSSLKLATLPPNTHVQSMVTLNGYIYVLAYDQSIYIGGSVRPRGAYVYISTTTILNNDNIQWNRIDLYNMRPSIDYPGTVAYLDTDLMPTNIDNAKLIVGKDYHHPELDGIYIVGIGDNLISRLAYINVNAIDLGISVRANIFWDYSFMKDAIISEYEKNRELLHLYVFGNSKEVDVKVYGLSTNGCDGQEDGFEYSSDVKNVNGALYYAMIGPQSLFAFTDNGSVDEYVLGAHTVEVNVETGETVETYKSVYKYKNFENAYNQYENYHIIQSSNHFSIFCRYENGSLHLYRSNDYSGSAYQNEFSLTGIYLNIKAEACAGFEYANLTYFGNDDYIFEASNPQQQTQVAQVGVELSPFIQLKIRDTYGQINAVILSIDGSTYSATYDDGWFIFNVEDNNVSSGELESMTLYYVPFHETNVVFLLGLAYLDTSEEHLYSHEFSNFPEEVYSLNHFMDLVDASDHVNEVVASIKQKIMSGDYHGAASEIQENRDLINPYYIDSSIVNKIEEELRNIEIYTKLRKQSFYYQQLAPLGIVGDVWVNKGDGDIVNIMEPVDSSEYYWTNAN